MAHGIASSVDGEQVRIGSAHFIFEDEKCVIPEDEQAKLEIPNWGHVHFSPMTGYALQQFIKKHLALICSHSAGSMQALSKLEIYLPTPDCKPRKKVFTVTDAGGPAFFGLSWKPAKNKELAGLAKPEARILAGTSSCFLDWRNSHEDFL